MKRWMTLSLVLWAIAPAVAMADTSAFLADMVAKNSGALAAIRYTVEMETGNRTVLGQGICIAPSGVFLTTAMDPRMSVDTLKDFEVITPGVGGKTLKAKLLGIDAWTGFGFVQATDKHTWQVVGFSRTSKLALGQQVGSIGLMMGDPAMPVQVGTAYVGALLRVPNELVYITGGNLTGACSPVFATDGRAVGLVARQLYLGYQTPSRQGVVPLQLRGQQETSFFTPVEDFVQVLESIPADGQVGRLPWLGVNKFEAVGKELAEIYGLDKPAVRIDQVIPGQPAAKAGLQNRDVIVEVDGKPLEKLAAPELTVRAFVADVMRMKVGTKMALKIFRGRETKDISLTLGEMPTRPNEAKRYFNKALGLLVREKVMLDEYLDKSDAAKVPGLIVMGVVRASAAAAADLRAGDVVTNVNNQPVTTINVLKQVVERSLAADRTAAISFLVRREDQAQVITVKPAP